MDVLSILGWNWTPSDPRWDILFACSVSILLAGIFLVTVIRTNYHGEIDPASLFSLALMGGVSFLILLAFPIFLAAAWLRIGLNFRAIFLALAIGLGIGSVFLAVRYPRRLTGPTRIFVVLALMLCALCLVRLAFIRDLVLPPYSDSVEHYLIVTDLLHPERAPDAFYNMGNLSSHYYHFGFHALAGWTAALSSAPVSQVLLVLGQILQALIPLSLFFIVRTLTRSNAAGLFAVLLAGLGWRMPAFASNWGKYPALTGIVTFLFALSMLYLAGSAAGRKETQGLLATALAAGLVSALTHTRSLLLLVIAVGSWWIAGRIVEGRRAWRNSALLISAPLLMWIVIQITRTPELTFMMEPYARAGFYSTLLVALLLPYGLKYFPRPMFSALLFLLLLLMLTLVALPAELERLSGQTLLDRPFAQMILFLPLSAIGGFGLAGVGRDLAAKWRESRRRELRGKLWIAVSLLLCLAVTVHALHAYDFSPSSCCTLAKEDDLAAFDWIENHLPKDAVILIASIRTPSRSLGVDGGLWITALTGYRTEKWPHDAALDSAANLAQMCAKGATHLFVGGTASRFVLDPAAIPSGWYELLFAADGALLYRISGCQ
ncbi:MAG TPA: hypothetical protein VGJ22_10100 [Anaerolineales bacterium]